MKFLPILAVTLLASVQARAQLPMLQERPWIGYFLGYELRKARLGFSAKGVTLLEPTKRNGTVLAATNPIKLAFEITETLPDGKTVRKVINDDAFTSESQAAADPKVPVKITGKVTGDATFEIYAIPERGAVSFGGRIVDQGTLKNPLTFAILMVFEPYKFNGGQRTPEQEKNFTTKAKRDEIRFITPKGERSEIGFLDEGNPAETAKDGFTSAEIRTEAYDGLSFKLTASANSKITIVDKGDQALWEGFTLRWAVNEGADAKTQKFTIETK